MECPICYETFSEVRPKNTLRGCGHDVCLVCKTNIFTSGHLVVQSQDVGLPCPLVTCPICRKVEKIPCERIDDVITYYKGRLVADGNAIRQHCDEKRRLQQEVQRLRTQVGTQAVNLEPLNIRIEVLNGSMIANIVRPPAPALAPPPPVAPAPAPAAVAPAVAPAVAHRQFRRFHRRDIEAMLGSNVETLDYMAERETEDYAGTTEFYYMEIRNNGYLIDTVSRYIYERIPSGTAISHYRRLNIWFDLVAGGWEHNGGFQVPIVPGFSNIQYEYVHIPVNMVLLRNGNVEPPLAAGGGAAVPAPTTRINPTVVNHPHANRSGVNATTRHRQPDWIATGSARRWCNCSCCPTLNRTSRKCDVYNCNKHACRSCMRCETHNPDYNQPIPN